MKKEKFMEMLAQAKEDEYGRLYGNKEIGVAFTSSQYGSLSAMTYLKTYRIFATTFKLPY